MPAFAAGVSSIGVTDGEKAVFERDFHAEAVEATASVVLHVLEVVRIHKLTVRIERREHAFHRGIDQVVIADFLAIDIIPPDQLDGFGERRDFRVAVLIASKRSPVLDQRRLQLPGEAPRKAPVARNEVNTLKSRPRLINIMIGRKRPDCRSFLCFCQPVGMTRSASPSKLGR